MLITQFSLLLCRFEIFHNEDVEGGGEKDRNRQVRVLLSDSVFPPLCNQTHLWDLQKNRQRSCS